MMQFDRASNLKGFRACILLASLEGTHTSIFIKPDLDVSNIVVEYKVCFIG